MVRLAELILGALKKLFGIERKLRKMSQQLDDLTAKVAANTDVIESALVLITNIHDQLVAAGTDQAKLTELASTLANEDQKLADAVAANTPAAP